MFGHAPSKTNFLVTALIVVASLIYFGQRRAAMESHSAKITAITPLNSTCGPLKTRRNCTRYQADVTYATPGGIRTGQLIIAELDGHNRDPLSAGVPKVGESVKVYADQRSGSLETDIARPNQIYWILAGAAALIFYGVRRFRRNG